MWVAIAIRTTVKHNHANARGFMSAATGIFRAQTLRVKALPAQAKTRLEWGTTRFAAELAQ
jgi:hypothetical protein